MCYYDLHYQTWEREECYGMFDYSDPNTLKSHDKIPIKSSGLLYRNSHNHQLLFIDKQTAPPQNYLPFIKIDETQGRLFITNCKQQEQNEPLCKIISTQTAGHKLKEGQKIRLGKANLQLLRLSWKKTNVKNHYQQVSEPKVSQKESVFDCSFYSCQQKASMLQSNPACRYCYSRTINQQNPFLVVCKCSGHVKYIHQQCLIEWVKKRSGIMSDLSKAGVYYSTVKAFTCEVCKELYTMDRLIKHVFEVKGEELAQFAIMYVSGEPDMIYVIDLGVLDLVSIGRSIQSSIIINELSVSRNHCVLSVNKQKKQLVLADSGAKFGTVIVIDKTEVNDKQDFQKGRTRLTFTKHQAKLSFFQRLGFCSLQPQNLGRERLSD